MGDLTCDAINIDACRKYVKARTGGAHGRRPVVEATARRELETLAAALNLLHRHGKLDRPIPIAKPDAGQPNERWLTRMEAARRIGYAAEKQISWGGKPPVRSGAALGGVYSKKGGFITLGLAIEHLT